MLHIIEIAYLLMSVLSVVAMWPQIKQLLTTKQSDELNLGTWIIWGSYQVIALFYSIAIHAVPYIIANVAWVTFYVVMIGLIIKYRKNTPVPAVAEVSASETQMSYTSK